MISGETVISSTYLRPADGIRMVYCQQSYLGIPVFNKMQVLAFRNNQLVSVSGGRMAHLEQIIDLLEQAIDQSFRCRQNSHDRGKSCCHEYSFTSSAPMVNSILVNWVLLYTM